MLFLKRILREKKKSPEKTFGLTALLGVLTAIDAMSIDIYLPAMPVIARDFLASEAALQNTLSIYLFALAIAQCVIGGLSDKYGRKTMMLISILLYILGSILAGQSNSLSSLIIGRIFQAVGAAAGMVIPRAVVTDIYDTRESARVISLLMMILGVVPIVAPGIGSLLLLNFGWQSIFLHLAIVGAICLVWALCGMPETVKQYALGKEKRGDFLLLMSNKNFLLFTACSSIAFGSMFGYISAMPFIFSGGGFWGEKSFGWIAAVISSGFMIGASVNLKLLDSFSINKIIRWSLLSQPLCGVLIAISASLSSYSLPSSMVCGFLFMVSLGLVVGNTISVGLNSVTDSHGSASSYMGLLQFIMGGAGVLIASWLIAKGVSVGYLILVFGMVGFSLFLAVESEKKYSHCAEVG